MKKQSCKINMQMERREKNDIDRNDDNGSLRKKVMLDKEENGR